METDGKILSPNLFPVIGIGASAGGLDAFKKLLKAIPEHSGMAYVLVQHLAPTHESLLPELLQKVTAIPVLEISDDIEVQPDHIYILPSNKMMVANDGVLQLSPRSTNKNELNLPIDLFFNSLAAVHQNQAIGVVLSGTGSDGTRGLQAIKENGGITFAQDIDSSAYASMPQSAIQAEVVDFILPPEEIPQKLLDVTRIINENGGNEQVIPAQDNDVFKQMLSSLRARKGTDFTHYKQTTIRRRILRRMAINKNDSPTDYLTYLRKNKIEQDILYQDLLISVTAFFRDTKTFDHLCETVVPLILKNKPAGEPIRIWVAGCSTGEEAYSIAICFSEFLGENPERVQIFATDLSEPAIAKARTGIYTKKEVGTVTPHRLHEFFTKTKGNYQVNQEVRNMCVFAHQNFLKDPPFGKIDLVSCRNVLIYMEPYLQKKALTTFHYSLNATGFLLLGKSETISSVPDLFAIAKKNDKLFSRKDVPGKFMHIASQRSELNLSQTNARSNNEISRTDYKKTADDIILSKYTPASVIVNEAMDIVDFRGPTSRYLEQDPGKPSHNLLLMAKYGLAFELRNVLHKAKKEKVPIRKEHIPFQLNGNLSIISIEAIPLSNTIDSHYLVLFHDTNSIDNQQKEVTTKKAITKSKKDTKDQLIQQLEQELAQAREDMRDITQEQEAVNEELQSANEELLSGNEKLQSLNEELETGKEELQSTNEELMVVNQEILGLNEQVTAARDYAEAIIGNIREPLLVLDQSLRVKKANNAFYKTFRVNTLETEEVLIYDIGNKQWDIPELRILLERILPEKSTFNDFEITHTFSTIGERIMLLNAREIVNKNSLEKLILLSIEDVTERKKAEDIVRKSGDRFRSLLTGLPAAVYSCDAQGRILFYNNAAVDVWGREPEIGKELWCGSWKIFTPDGLSIPLESSPMAIAIKEKRAIMGEEIIIERPNGTQSNVLVYPQPEFNLLGELTGAINIGFDITELVNATKKIKESEKEFRQLTDLMPQKIANANESGAIFYYNQEWLSYTGFSIDELLGSGWAKVVHPDELDEITNQWQHFIDAGNDFEIIVRLLNKNGGYKWHLSRASAVRDHTGKIIKWISAATQIQDQIEQKEDLEKSVVKRTHELQEANETLKEKNRELQHMNKELESFAYVSSHDLQEPLRKIQTFAGRILDKENQNLTDNGKDYLQRLQLAAARMQQLIQDLLAFSQLNTAKRKFETTDLNLLINEVVSDLSETIQEKHAIIDATELGTAAIIVFQFRQLMHNLISNALKFSNPDVPPHIRIKSSIVKGSRVNNPTLSPEKNYCHITVIDNGIGFEPRYRERIFEVFQRLHSQEQYNGTGIGLAIAKKIVENHNGIITATSQLNEGARFDMYIPAT